VGADPDRCAVLSPDGLHGFPRNTAIDVMLTFTAGLLAVTLAAAVFKPLEVRR